MKHLIKIVFTAILSVLMFDSTAQTLNQNAAWPNTAWTLSGTYNDPASVLEDPTTSANFAFDDDNEGNNPQNDIAIAESPVIDLTPAFNAGELAVEISGVATFESSSGGDLLSIEYYNAGSMTWVNLLDIGSVPAAVVTTYANCTNTLTFTTPALDISAFTPIQLSGFKYRIKYDDQSGWEYGFCIDAPTIASIPPTCPIPTAQTAANITNTSADLGWTDNAGATTWDLEIIIGGNAPTGTPTDAGVTTNPFSATGLTAGTTYDFYVRSDCGGGDFSSWAGPFSFTTTGGTPCADPTALASANETQTTADLSWTDNASAALWDVEVVATGVAGTGNPTDAGVANPFTKTGLTAGTTYDFYVRADCGGGLTSSWVGPFTFSTTAAPTCVDPSALITSNVTSTSADLSWTENGSATLWDIEIYSGTATGTPTNTGVATNPFSATGLTPGTTYEFCVRADCGGGNFSAWVCGGQFTTTAATGCTDPTALASANETQTTAELSWTENGTATLWDIEVVATGVAGTGTPTDAGVTNSFVKTGLTAGTTYDFYVRADCGGGTTSNWVGPFTFTTLQTICVDPSDLAVTNITSAGADLGWTENGTATTWDIELVESGVTPTGVATDAGVTNNPFTKTGLLAATDYEFYVRADCGGGQSNWVGPFAFTTLPSSGCADPSDLAATSIGSTFATLSWIENGTAAAWNIEVVTAGTASTGVATNPGVGNPFTVTGLVAETDYEYYVQADCNGTESNWVGPFAFTTTDPCEMPTGLDATNVGDTEGDLFWTPGDAETEWEIELVEFGTTPTGVATHTASSMPLIQVTGLTAGTGYQYLVRANCGAEFSDWTTPFTFQTTANVEELDALLNTKIYPNPSNGLFTIEMNASSIETVQLSILNLEGKVVVDLGQLATGNSINQKVDLSGFAKGLYLLNVQTDKGKTVYKVSLK